MKNLVSLFLALVLCLSLCSCGVSPDSAYSFIARMDDKAFDPSSVSSKECESLFKSDVFSEAVIATIKGDIGLYKVCHYLSNLESMGYRSENVKAAFDEVFGACLEGLRFSDDNVDEIIKITRALALFSDDSYYYEGEERFVTVVCDLITDSKLTLIKGSSDEPTESAIAKCLYLADDLEGDNYWAEYHNEAIKNALQAFVRKYVSELSSDGIAQFINDVQFELEENYYFSIIDFFPYDVFAELAETDGEVLSLVNGYYSENRHDSKYRNEHYWYDPLGNKKYGSGGVGLFERTISYTAYGDFMHRDYSSIAYGSSGHGRGDEIIQELWVRCPYANSDDYTNVTVASGKDGAIVFLDIAKRGTIYSFGKNHKELAIVVVEKDMLTFSCRGRIFSVSYS